MTLKTKTINTGKATILVVDLPKGANILWIRENFIRIEFKPTQKSFFHEQNIKIPYGKWKPIGFADQLTESDAWQIIPDPKNECCGCNHPVTNQCCGNKVPEYDSAIQEINSLLKANGIVTVNPYEKPEDCGENCGCDGMFILECSDEFNRWQQAESELWTNPAILIKE